jgi:hypothetical protein
MVRAIVQDSCPFCGAMFISGHEEIYSCYKNIEPVVNALGSFEALLPIFAWENHIRIDEFRTILIENMEVLQSIFGMRLVTTADIATSTIEVRTGPTPQRSSGKPKSIKRQSEGKKQEVAQPANKDGSLFSQEAIQSLPEEFRELVRTDSDLQELMREVVFSSQGE